MIETYEKFGTEPTIIRAPEFIERTPPNYPRPVTYRRPHPKPLTKGGNRTLSRTYRKATQGLTLNKYERRALTRNVKREF